MSTDTWAKLQFVRPVRVALRGKQEKVTYTDDAARPTYLWPGGGRTCQDTESKQGGLPSGDNGGRGESRHRRKVTSERH